MAHAMPDNPVSPDSTRAITDYGTALRAWSRFASPRIIALFILSALALRLSLGNWHWADGALMFLGLALWPFLEWFLHKYLLHIKPFRVLGFKVDPGFSRAHRAHHRQPWRPELIVLPPLIPLLQAPALLAFAWWLAPDTALTLSALIGVGIASLNYEWTHFMVHTRIRPKNRYYQGLFRSHRLHHFRNENYWYGFTLTSVDRMLGTGPSPGSTERSEHCHDLGVDA